MKGVKMRFDKGTLARTIKSKRALLGWNQTELAMRSGVSLSTVSAYEAESIDKPAFTNVVKIAESLDASLDDFVAT